MLLIPATAVGQALSAAQNVEKVNDNHYVVQQTFQEERLLTVDYGDLRVEAAFSFSSFANIYPRGREDEGDTESRGTNFGMQGTSDVLLLPPDVPPSALTYDGTGGVVFGRYDWGDSRDVSQAVGGTGRTDCPSPRSRDGYFGVVCDDEWRAKDEMPSRGHAVVCQFLSWLDERYAGFGTRRIEASYSGNVRTSSGTVERSTNDADFLSHVADAGCS